MGSDDHYPDEGPVRSVAVDSFWIDSTPVSNDDFARFMDDTGHVTLAETAPRAEDYPEALPDDLPMVVVDRRRGLASPNGSGFQP